jgi:hypothetical protein
MGELVGSGDNYDEAQADLEPRAPTSGPGRVRRRNLVMSFDIMLHA